MAEEIFNRDPNQKIGKQIVLPFSRALEISLKSLKIRFWRSIITISSIVLAIAFLAYIMVNTTIIRSLKEGPDGAVKTLKVQHDKLQDLGQANAALQKEPANAELRTLITRLEAETGVQAPDAAARLAETKKRLADKRMVADKIRVTLQVEGSADDTETVGVPAVGKPETKSQIRGFFSEMKAKDYWLVSLALLVCFVGIVNAMLMSVTERFREIGTMKCLGALDSFIVKLFLLESVFQGALGTAIGIALGTILAVLRAWALYGGAVFTYFPWIGILTCIVLAQAIGTLLSILASVFPARAAARMQPVDALRAEQ